MRKATVLDLLREIEPLEDKWRNVVALARGNEDSYDNAVSALFNDIFPSGAGAGRSIFPLLFSDGISAEAITRSFEDILRADRDLLWLEDLPTGGFVAHTPHGRMIIGADRHQLEEDEIDSAALAVFTVSSAMRTNAPLLAHLDFKAVVEGDEFPFDDEATTADGALRVERVNNYEVMIEGYGSKLWSVSLIEQFSRRVAATTNAADYLQAWESLSSDLYLMAEKLLFRLERAFLRPEGIDNASTARSVGLDAMPLKALFGAFKGFRKNEALGGRWESAFVAGLMDHFLDRLPWIDLAGNPSALTALVNIFRNAETADSCRGIFCPLSLMRSFGAEREARPWLDVRVSAPHDALITARNNRHLKRLAARLVFLMGASYAYDGSAPASSLRPVTPARVDVDWRPDRRTLVVTDLTEGRSAFAALGPASHGRAELDTLAARVGGKIEYRHGSMVIEIPSGDDNRDPEGRDAAPPVRPSNLPFAPALSPLGAVANRGPFIPPLNGGASLMMGLRGPLR
ncbi:MAG: hypothetical protein JXA24_07925 [Proteobacteria bacterium]|nr:hypothetical protein [Pseudomonadota bacterium]